MSRFHIPFSTKTTLSTYCITTVTIWHSQVYIQEKYRVQLVLVTCNNYSLPYWNRLVLHETLVPLTYSAISDSTVLLISYEIRVICFNFKKIGFKKEKSLKNIFTSNKQGFIFTHSLNGDLSLIILTLFLDHMYAVTRVL